MHGAPLFVLYFIFRSFRKSGFPTNKLNDNQMMFALNLAAGQFPQILSFQTKSLSNILTYTLLCVNMLKKNI